ncbi:hypothetical protein MRX96_001577 [Rhipicephalus microplus]
MKTIGRRTMSGEREASKTSCHEGQRGLEKLGEAGICVAAVTAFPNRQRDRHNFIIPLPLLDEIDGPEDRVSKREASETAGHGGHRGLPKDSWSWRSPGACRRTLGRHGRYGAAIPTSLARQREWYKYMVPPLPPDKNDWLEDRVWESEASETACHEGQWGLNKLGKAGKCGAAVPTLVTRQRERHNFTIPLPLLDEIDGPEDRVSKCEASEIAGHGGQRGLPK